MTIWITALTGGLAGAIISLFLKEWLEREKKATARQRLSVLPQPLQPIFSNGIRLRSDKDEFIVSGPVAGARLRVFNDSDIPLHKCWAYLSVQHAKEDKRASIFIPHGVSGNQCKSFIGPDTDERLNEDRLSWSGQAGGKNNPACVDILAGEKQSLEVFAFYEREGMLAIYSEAHDSPYRIFLDGTKSYRACLKIVCEELPAKEFNLLITASNKHQPVSVVE